MSQQQFQNKRKPNALAEYKLRIVGKPPSGQGRAPTLGIVVVKNQPHIVVRTNVENDKNYGKIEAKLDTFTFFGLMKALQQVAAGENGDRLVISNMGHPFANGQRSKEPKLDTKILVGKSAEGVVWIAVTSWEQGRPVIQFPFAPTQYHQWAHGDGRPVTEAEASQIYVAGYIEAMKALVPFILFDEYVEPEQRNQGGGNSSGGWQNNQGGGQQRRGGSDYSNSGGGGGYDAAGGMDDGLPL